MSVFFSRQCEYALQAVLFMALKERGAMTSSRELTERLGVPYHFLGKILQRLANRKLLTSQKGPTGGFALALPAQEITLFHVVEAIDGVGFTNQCLLGFSECSGRNPCAVHNQWTELREDLYEALVRKSVKEMAKEMKKPGYKLP